ncbi:MAG: nuclease family protein [Frankiales bacterium]|nr:nuclease family protein [Frankiales bacterium]
MQQLGLEGMPTRLFSCTPSRLTSWLDCPRRYRMTYLDRPPLQKGPAWAHNTVGAVAHLALARWWDLPEERRTGPAARGLLERAWQTDGFSDDEQAHRWKGFAGDMVERYADGLDPAEDPVGIERTVAFKTDTLAVSGRVDRVDRRGDELVVVDYKTGRSALTEDDARGSLALALYALACARTLRTPCTKVELHHLPSGKVLAWEHTPETLARHVRRAEAIATEAAAAKEELDEGGPADELFPPRPSSLCGWCDFSRHCPEGLAASGGPNKPWAGLAEERAPLDEVS